MLMLVFASNVLAASMCCTPVIDEELLTTMVEDGMPCHGQDKINADNGANFCASCVSMMAAPDDSMLTLEFRQINETSVARLIIGPADESLYRPPINHLS